MNFKKIYSELKRRNIFKVAMAYAIAGWLIIQVISTISPQLGFPAWVAPFFTVLVLAGFPIALIIAWAFELTPEGLKKTHQVAKDESITDHTGKKINRLTLTALSLLVVFLLVERVFFAESTFGNNSETTFETASIAVLPFVNMSSDQENEYFSDGLSEELLNALAKVEDMKVAGRTSSFKFKGHNDDLKKIGQELGVAHILEGSVRKSGNQVRITAQLIKVDDGYHLWSETYDRELKDIFAIQEEISRKVLNELKVRLLEDDEAELEAIPTHDIEAYQAYLKANQLVVNRNYDEIEAAIELYKTAIRLDPGFAGAHANLALAYNGQAYYGNIPFEEMQQNIKSYADQAMLLNDQSAEAFAALGNYYENASELDKALEAMLKSNELNPNLIDNYNWIGNLYENFGEIQKQMEWYRRGYEKDPLNPLAIYNRARVSLEERNYEEMESFLKKNIRINPDFVPTYFLKGVIAFGAPFGRYDESFENLYRTHKLDPNFPRAMSLMVYVSNVLDLERISDQFFLLLKENYSQSFEYRNAIGTYENRREKYNFYEDEVLTYIEENEVIPSDRFTYFDMYDYAMATGSIERVLPFFKRFDSGLFADTLQTLNRRNAPKAYVLAELLERKGDVEQANRLTKAYCDFADRSFEWTTNGKEDSEYLVPKAVCAFLKKDIVLMHTFMHKLYREHRAMPFLEGTIRVIKNNYPTLYTSEIEVLDNEISADLKKQRENVIKYLKENNEWREEWDNELQDKE